MQIENITTKIKCDASGCGNISDYKIINKRFVFNGSYYLCKNCFGELYNKMGEVLIPKSPEPIFKKKGVRDDKV